jgi:hypothetical protein
MPSIKSIEEKAPWLIEDENQENERIINEQLKHQEMEQAMIKMLNDEVESAKEIQAKKHEAEMIRQEIIKNATFKIKSKWSGLLSNL